MACGFLLPLSVLYRHKSDGYLDNGNKDSGKGSNKDGSNDNNHRSSMDTCCNMGSHMGCHTSSYRLR